MKVKLLTSTPNMLDVVYTSARTCYNAGSPIDMWFDVCTIPTDKKLKLVEFCIKNMHHSVLEHGYFTFSVEGISRATSLQLVRHRLCSFCLAGDTIIKQRGHGESRTIKELFDSSKQYNDVRRIRCVNEQTRELQYDPIKEVIYSGIKPVYEVTTEFGYKIKTTMQHRFFTENGWKRLSELSVGDTVFVNGISAYKDKEWLQNQYNFLNKSQEEISLECGVSKHTIRKWIRNFGLQKPIGSWSIGVAPVNKGKTKYDYEPMMRTSEKMIGNKNGSYASGENHHSWKKDGLTTQGGYNRTYKICKRTNICSNCGAIGNTHIHHMDKNPTNTSMENIKELCTSCHTAIHKKEVKEVIIPNKILSIEYVGEVDTYDIEMAGTNHNFIANGFVVHNSQQSQRYCRFDKENLSYITPTTIQEDKEAKDKFDKLMQDISDVYECFLEWGIPAEDARAVLPNACTTNINMSLNLRQFIHICQERLCSSAQQEIRDLVSKMRDEILKLEPWLEPYLQPKCVLMNKCTEGKKCCGYLTLYKRKKGE